MFLVVGPMCWGKGETPDAAYRKARSFKPSWIKQKPGQKMPHIIYAYDPEKTPEMFVDDMGNVNWRGDNPIKTRVNMD